MSFRKKVVRVEFFDGGKYGVTSTTFYLSCGHKVVDSGFHRRNQPKKGKSKFCGECERASKSSTTINPILTPL